MSATMDVSVGLYLGSSVVKLYVAEYHLESFRSAAVAVSPEVDWPFVDPPTQTLLAVYGHADACVLQLVGAFDAWACAAGWALGLGEPDRFTFKKLSGGRPAAIREEIKKVSGDPVFELLLEYRHNAAHRGIVGQKRVLSSDAPGELLIKTEAGGEVLPLLEEMAGWARPVLTSLHHFADAIGWRVPPFDNAPHRL